MVAFKGLKYGAFAGFVATWSISSVIVVTELLLGLQIGAFYSIMGISLGVDNVIAATSMAFGLHLLIGTIIGAVFGVIGIRWKKVRMFNPYKSLLVGMAAGMIVWLVLFLPIATFLVQPAINSITTMLAIESQDPVFSEDINQSIRNITLTAIAFHLIWGAIFGFIISSLLRIRLFRIKQHYNDIVNIDPNIRLVTICDSDGKTMYSRHREGVENLLTPEETKKSLEMALDGLVDCREKADLLDGCTDAWPRPRTMVGDGMSDHAVFARGLVDRFIAFTANVRRPAVVATGAPEARDAAALGYLLSS
jgi:hypothetical protein